LEQCEKEMAGKFEEAKPNRGSNDRKFIISYPVLTPEALKAKESPVTIDLPPEVRRRMELLYYVVMVVNPSNHSAHVRTRRKPVPPLAQSGSDAKYVATTADLFPLVDKVKVHPVELQP
jgi:hypothetical protein